jgi:hypothetical protein
VSIVILLGALTRPTIRTPSSSAGMLPQNASGRASAERPTNAYFIQPRSVSRADAPYRIAVAAMPTAASASAWGKR